MKTTAIAFGVVVLWSLKATAAQDYEAYCAYIREKADSDRIVLNSPNLIGRYSQHEYGSNYSVAILGIQQDLTQYLKAQDIGNLADVSCAAYELKYRLEGHLKYALAEVEQAALKTRIEQSEVAIEELKKILEAHHQLIQAGNSTIDIEYRLKSWIDQIRRQRNLSESNLSALQIPDIKNGAANISELVERQHVMDREYQRALNAVARDDDWGLQVTTGMAKDFSSNQSISLYIGVNARYNLGDFAKKETLDRVAEKYAEWKKQQVTESHRAFDLLKQTVRGMVNAENEAQRHYLERLKEIDQYLDDLSGFDSDKAVGMKYQMQAERALAALDADVSARRLDALHQLNKRLSTQAESVQ